jgi:hypothetical protein
MCNAPIFIVYGQTLIVFEAVNATREVRMLSLAQEKLVMELLNTTKENRGAVNAVFF